MIERQTLLGRAATLQDVGNAAAFAASDWPRSMTAAIVNVSCVALIDQPNAPSVGRRLVASAVIRRPAG
ncbi:MAG TPA: hypothetical protein VLB47_02960 [Solirubrobacteraceae bacterium]|nr:hypothetical protein [Solirubrobacteraceae bacterium]